MEKVTVVFLSDAFESERIELCRGVEVIIVVDDSSPIEDGDISDGKERLRVTIGNAGKRHWTWRIRPSIEA